MAGSQLRIYSNVSKLVLTFNVLPHYRLKYQLKCAPASTAGVHFDGYLNNPIMTGGLWVCGCVGVGGFICRCPKTGQTINVIVPYFDE